MNEFSEELEKFIEETAKKAVDEYTAKIIEEIVKKTLGRYCVETNNQIELLTTVINMLTSVLVAYRFPSTEEIKAIMNKAMEDKAKELNEKIFDEKSEKSES